MFTLQNRLYNVCGIRGTCIRPREKPKDSPKLKVFELYKTRNIKE